jgi:hypothetical protein
VSLARSGVLLAASLACDLGPGKPDAAAVLSLGTITEDHLRQRLAACPVHAGELVAALRREARGRGAG